MKKMASRDEEMVRMRNAGASYAEIANRYGISKQRVYQIVGREHKAKFRPLTEARCVYPVLRKWMNDNRISKAELCRRMYGNNSGTNSTNLCEILCGRQKGVTKSTIDKLIKATGLKYEELFYEGETHGEERNQHAGSYKRRPS